MAVNVEMWRPDIVENLYAKNEFLKESFNADEYVLGGSVVHIPQAGVASEVSEDVTSFPLAVEERVDTDVTYPLNRLSTKAIRISEGIDKAELSYDKRQSVIRDNMMSVLSYAGTRMIYNWTKNVPNTAASRVATTGAAVAASGAAMTGTRKAITAADIRKAQQLLDEQDVDSEGRILIITPEQKQQLLGDQDIKNVFYAVGDYKAGNIPEYAGFKIYVRSRIVRVASDGTVKLPTAANAALDSFAAVFYQRDCAERALGTVDLFDNQRRAEYQGDLLSFLLRIGGRARRADSKGVGLIVQGA